jgi:hypothetical protein
MTGPPAPGPGSDQPPDGYTPPPPTSAPALDTAGPYTRGPFDPAAYRPVDGPDDPWASFMAKAPRTSWSTFKGVVGLGWVVLVAAVLVVVSDLFQIVARVREYRLAGDLQNDLDAVSFDRIHAVDDFTHAANQAALGALLLAGVLFLVWFHRVRWNAEAYGTHEQRRSQGWAIGSWICPVIAFFYPYQMTTDVLLASEATPDSRSTRESSIPLVNIWWAAWLIHNIVGFIARFGRSTPTLSGLRTADVTGVVSSALDIGAAILFMLVVHRIMRAQRRWPALVSAAAVPQGPDARSTPEFS